jgi:hypothetical protein
MYAFAQHQAEFGRGYDRGGVDDISPSHAKILPITFPIISFIRLLLRRRCNG